MIKFLKGYKESLRLRKKTFLNISITKRNYGYFTKNIFLTVVGHYEIFEFKNVQGRGKKIFVNIGNQPKRVSWSRVWEQYKMSRKSQSKVVSLLSKHRIVYMLLNIVINLKKT